MMKALFKFYGVEKVIKVPDHLVIIHDLANELANRADVISDPVYSVFDEGWEFLGTETLKYFCTLEGLDKKGKYVLFHETTKEEVIEDIRMYVELLDLETELSSIGRRL